MGGGTGLMILGGLLQGAGKGVQDEYEARRQDALLALKRQYDVEDRDAQIAATASNTQALIEGRKEEIVTTGDQNRLTESTKGAEDRLTEAVKGEREQSNIKLKGNIDLSHDKTIEALKHDYNLDEAKAKELLDTQHDLELAHITPDHYEVASNGQIIIWKKDGTAYTRGADGSFEQRHNPPSDDSLDIPGMTGGSSSSAKPAAKPAGSNANDGAKKQALARLPGIYLQAKQNPEQFRNQYPGMFDANGNLRPLSELKAEIDQKYGG